MEDAPAHQALARKIVRNQPVARSRKVDLEKLEGPAIANVRRVGEG